MPVDGLPSTVEVLLNKLLFESDLSSFKIAGNSRNTTVVLRFSEIMASQSMDLPSRCVVPGQWRRKPPSQIRRDQERQNNFRTDLLTKTQMSTPTDCQLHLSTDAVARSMTFDSGHITSLQSPSNSETNATVDITMSPTTVTTRRVDTKVNEQTAREKCTQDQESNDATITNYELLHRLQKATEIESVTSESNTELTEFIGEDRAIEQNTQDSEGVEKEERKDQQQTLLSNQSMKEQVNTPRTEGNNSEFVDMRILGGDCQRHKFALYIDSLSSEVKKKLMDMSRNKQITRAVNDYRVFSVIAETDDLILEYDFEQCEISDWYAKEKEKADSHLPRVKWKLQRWLDQSEDHANINAVGECVKAIRHLIAMNMSKS